MAKKIRARFSPPPPPPPPPETKGRINLSAQQLNTFVSFFSFFLFLFFFSERKEIEQQKVLEAKVGIKRCKKCNYVLR